MCTRAHRHAWCRQLRPWRAVHAGRLLRRRRQQPVVPGAGHHRSDPDDALGNAARNQGILCRTWLGPVGKVVVDYSVSISVLIAIPAMLLVGIAMERGLIRHFYKRPHAEQIPVTFGLATVIQELIKHFFGANPVPQARRQLCPAAPISANCWGLARLWSIPGVGWSISPSCSSRPAAWWCAPAWVTARRWACLASTSRSASPWSSALRLLRHAAAYSVPTPITSDETGLQLSLKDPRILDGSAVSASGGLQSPSIFAVTLSGYAGFHLRAVMLISASSSRGASFFRLSG